MVWGALRSLTRRSWEEFGGHESCLTGRGEAVHWGLGPSPCILSARGHVDRGAVCVGVSRQKQSRARVGLSQGQ